MKVIFCLKYFMPDHVAGTEVYVAALCHAIQKSGNDVVVVKPGFKFSGINEYYFQGIRVIEYPESSIITKELQQGIVFPAGIKTFKEVIESEKPDIVHFHEVSGSNGITIEHLRIVNDLGIDVFTTLHLSGYVCKNNNFLYKESKACNGVINTNKCAICLLHSRGLKWGISDLVVNISRTLHLNTVRNTPSIFHYEEYIKNHKSQFNEIFKLSKKVFVLSKWFKEVLVQNGIPEEKLVLLKQALPQVPNTIHEKHLEKSNKVVRLVYVGRITKIKGLHVLLKAVTLLSPGTFVLDIYGKEDNTSYLKTCKMLSKSNQNIHWKGRLAAENVVETLGSYDALVLPSIVQEMAPLIIQEAFAAQLPVIGSDCKAVVEEIEDKVNGIIFPMNDAIELSGVLKNIIAHPSILATLKQKIVFPQSFNEVAKKTIVIYNSSSILQKVI